MAKLVTCVVDTGGTGDYTSLSTAEAANFGASSADITAAGSNEYIEVTCISTDGNPDTVQAWLYGRTTDATHTVTITGNASLPLSDNQYRLRLSHDAIVAIFDNYTKVKRLRVDQTTPTSDGQDAFQFKQAVIGSGFYNCIARFVGPPPTKTYDCYGFRASPGATGGETVGCLAYDYSLSNNVSGGFSTSEAHTYLACTAVNNKYNFYSTSASTVAKNCVAYGGTAGFGGPSWDTANSTNNAADIGSIPGANGVDLSSYSAEEIFEDPANDDYRLKQPRLYADDSPLYRTGADLSGDGVTEDIDGDTIIAWDIGCDHRPSRLVTVDPGGTGEYTSLSSAEAAYFGGNGTDLTTAQEIRTAECICTDGNADTTPVDVGGSTTDSTFGIKLRTHLDYWPDPIRFPTSGNYYRIVVTGTAALEVFDEYVTIERMCLYSDTNYGLNLKANGAVADGVIIYSPGYYGCVTYWNLSSNGTVTYRNCLVYSDQATNRAAFYTRMASSGYTLTVNFYNCTVAGQLERGFDVGTSAGTGIFVAKNCLGFVASDNFVGTYDAASTNNASGNADAPGSNAIDLSSYSASDLFRDPANGDYRLKVPDGLASDDHPLYRAGVNLYSDGVTDDIDGTGRSADVNFDVGCDQVGTVTRSPVIDIGGTGDYTSLSSAEAANFGAKGADLVAYDEKIEATWICTNGQAETTAVTISGQTTSDTNSITITVPKRYRMPRVWVSGNYARIETTNNPIWIAVGYATIAGAALKSISNYCIAIWTTSKATTIDSCILLMHDTTPVDEDHICLYVYNPSGYALIKNCLAILRGQLPAGKNNWGIAAYCPNTFTKFFGCTVVDEAGTAKGMLRWLSGTVYAKNCLSVGADDPFYGTFDSSSTHNASTAGDAPGSNAIDLSSYSLDEIFYDADNGEYWPASEDSPIYAVGANLYDEGVTEDIGGYTRPMLNKPHCVGAYELHLHDRKRYTRRGSRQNIARIVARGGR